MPAVIVIDGSGVIVVATLLVEEGNFSELLLERDYERDFIILMTN